MGFKGGIVSDRYSSLAFDRLDPSKPSALYPAAFHLPQWHWLLRLVYAACSCSEKVFSFPHPKPHWQKLVLEEIECEWKADGIEIELRF